MNPTRRILYPVLAAIAVVGLLAPSASAERVEVGTNLENMQAAFNGESNAHTRYLAFAKKADEEGYGAVASLFRAAARAEEIHAKAHASVIKGLGAEPMADVKAPEVGTTRENLKAALAGESFERDTMYPQFLQVARRDRSREAMRSLNFARMAEAEHAALYQQALDNLDAWKDEPRTFYVCPECGKTVTSLDFDKCGFCFTKAAKFEKVN